MAEVETKWAVIELGGKQHLVAVGVRILVNQTADVAGSTVALKSLLDQTPVSLKVLSHQRGPKISGLKFKNKVRYLKHYGHRQNLTTLEVTAIGAAKAAEAKAVIAKPAVKKLVAQKPVTKKTVKEKN